MTIREAVELVLQASALGNANIGVGGKIFVLDMGEPVNILELAQQMIRLAGFRPGKDVEIEITGPRPGEKLTEEVLHGSESLVPTDCSGLLLAAPRLAILDLLSRQIEDLAAAMENADTDRLFEIIRDLVPEYDPPIHDEPKRSLSA